MDSSSIVSSCAAASPFDALIFDLDDTLYSSKTGIGQALTRNVTDFLIEKCGFPESEAPKLNVKLFTNYGSTLAGLRASGYDIDADDYHSFVHGKLPYDLIRPDSRMRNILQSIKQRKIIFTNSDRIHAIKALDRLGIRDCFEKIICFETMNPNLTKSKRPDEFPVVLKPSIEAMEIAIHAAGVDPRRTLFFDDNVKNVAAGKAVGLRTVLVGRSTKSQGADYALERLTNMIQVIPEIFTARVVVNIEEEEDDFLIEKCGFPESEAPKLNVKLFTNYGSTLAGLRLCLRGIILGADMMTRCFLQDWNWPSSYTKRSRIRSSKVERKLVHELWKHLSWPSGS